MQEEKLRKNQVALRNLKYNYKQHFALTTWFVMHVGNQYLISSLFQDINGWTKDRLYPTQ